MLGVCWQRCVSCLTGVTCPVMPAAGSLWWPLARRFAISPAPAAPASWRCRSPSFMPIHVPQSGPSTSSGTTPQTERWHAHLNCADEHQGHPLAAIGGLLSCMPMLRPAWQSRTPSTNLLKYAGTFACWWKWQHYVCRVWMSGRRGGSSRFSADMRRRVAAGVGDGTARGWPQAMERQVQELLTSFSDLDSLQHMIHAPRAPARRGVRAARSQPQCHARATSSRIVMF